MKPISFSIKEDAIQAPGVDTGNMFETFLDANRSQTDRKIRTKTVIASVHFDVVFTRASVFVDVPFCFCAEKVNFFQNFY